MFQFGSITKGEHYLNNGDKYSGEFKGGLNYGRGVYSKSNGEIWKGEWENGSDGKWIVIKQNGEQFNVEYKDGKCVRDEKL